ncbi:hypothetical protein FQZ97_871750 [compost metagenome]
MKRRRHNATCRRSSLTSSAMSLFCQPCAASKTMLARCCTRASTRRPLDSVRNPRSVCASSSIASATRIAPTS